MRGGRCLRRLARYLGPWRKVVWCARRGDAAGLLQACLERLRACIQLELDAFAVNSPADSATEHRHAAQCVRELMALGEADGTYMLGQLCLTAATHTCPDKTILFIEWMAHRMACVVFVARRRVRLAGKLFCPPQYTLPVHLPFSERGLL